MVCAADTMQRRRITLILFLITVPYLCYIHTQSRPLTIRNNRKVSRDSMQLYATLPQTTTNSRTSFTPYDESILSAKCNESDIVKDFVFTKVEKTGSTTVFTIFTRFVLDNQLTVLAPLSAYHINWESERGKVHGWDIGPEEKERANVLADHAIYNKTMLDTYMVKGYKHVAIIREPVSWYMSAVQFFSKEPSFHAPKPANSTKQKPNYIAEDFLMKDNFFHLSRSDGSRIKSWFHLGQLQWLGFDYELRNNMSAITEYISWIKQRIDVIMLTEQFDASLVILRRKFCWNYTNIFYQRYMVQKKNQTDLSTEATQKLLSAEYNLGDKLLYESLNDSWWKQPELNEDNFWDEVAHFTELNVKISTSWCGAVINKHKSYTIAASQWHPTLHITSDLCQALCTKKELRNYVKHKTQKATKL